MKKIIVLIFSLMFIFIGCEKEEEESGSLTKVISKEGITAEDYYPIPYRIECTTVDGKLEVKANGIDEIEFLAKVYDQYGEIIEGKEDQVVYYEDDEEMDSNKFKTILPIKHYFKAKLGKLESEVLEINGLSKSKKIGG